MAIGDLNFNNPGAYFSPSTTYAGSLPMKEALNHYFGQLMGNDQQAQLAQGQAAQGPAQQYQMQMAQGGPMAGANAGGYGAYGNLMAGEQGARNTGRGVASQVKMGAEQGVADVGQAYGNDISGNIEAQIALRKAQAAQTALEQQQILGLTTGAAGLAGKIPGNLFSQFFGGGNSGGAAGFSASDLADLYNMGGSPFGLGMSGA
jgi:hypothetical protein